jgi:hypothetical protein
LFEELRRFDFGTIRDGEERFQPEIKASDATRLDSNFRPGHVVNNHDHEQFSERSPFNGECLDVTFNVSRIPILIDLAPNLDAIASQEFVASLLEGEGFVFSNLLKVGGLTPFL